MYRKKKFIRLWQRGYKNYIHYAIVVCYGNTRNRTTILDKLGYFNPNFKERKLEVNLQKMAYWMNRGAIVHTKVAKVIGFLSNYPINNKVK